MRRVGPRREDADVRLQRRGRHAVGAGRSTFGRSRSAGPLRLQLVDVDGDDARDVLEDAVEVAEVERRRRARRRRRRARRARPRARRPSDVVGDVAAIDARPCAREQDRERRVVRERAAGSSGRARGRARRRSGAGRRRRRARPPGRRRSGGSRARGRPRPRSPAPSPPRRTRARGRRSPRARPRGRTCARSGAFSRASSTSSGSAPPRAASGFVTPRSPGGRSSAVVSVSGADAAGDARADAVGGDDVARARSGPSRPSRRRRTGRGRAVVLRARRVHLGGRRLAVEARRLVPAHAVDADLERRLDAAPALARHVRQRLLLQREALERAPRRRRRRAPRRARSRRGWRRRRCRAGTPVAASRSSGSSRRGRGGGTRDLGADRAGEDEQPVVGDEDPRARGTAATASATAICDPERERERLDGRRRSAA